MLDGADELLLPLIVIGIVIIDQLTKAYIRSAMPVGDSITVIPGIFQITHIRNSGASFGILQNQRPIFLIVSIIVIVAMTYFYKTNPTKNILFISATSLIIGGAVGNFIDRLVWGKVTDFFDFIVWPVFNIADSALVVGVMMLGIYLLQDWQHAKHAVTVKD